MNPRVVILSLDKAIFVLHSLIAGETFDYEQLSIRLSPDINKLTFTDKLRLMSVKMLSLLIKQYK